jgi:hypothetical protein
MCGLKRTLRSEKLAKTASKNFLFACFLNGFVLSLAIAKFCLLHGADLRSKNDYAIGLAAQNGHLDVCQWLLKQGVPVDADDNYALIYAARMGHSKVVKWLVRHGASAQARDSLSVLFAAGNGHYAIVRFLLRHGACADVAMQGACEGRDVDFCRWLNDNFPVTPLLVAGVAVYLSKPRVEGFRSFLEGFRIIDAIHAGYDVLDVNRHKNVCRTCSDRANAQWTEKLTEKSLEQLAQELPSPAEVAEMLGIEDNLENEEDEEHEIEVEFNWPEQLNPPIKAFPLD